MWLSWFLSVKYRRHFWKTTSAERTGIKLGLFGQHERRGGLMISVPVSGSSGPGSSPGARFSKAPETFRSCKAIFHSFVCKNGEVYRPETSCMKWTSPHIEKIWIKQLCNLKVRDFALALRARKVSGAFEKRAAGRGHCVVFLSKKLDSHCALSTQRYKWVPVNLMLGVSLRWTGIPSRGE